MINHGRTLLLNIWAQSAQKQQAGYEYIPGEFRPLVLPTALKTVRRVLFGSNPDQRFLNLRARELLSYVHQTPVADYLYKLDSRVTYWPEATDSSFKYLPALRLTQISGPSRSVAFGGEFTANNSTGRANRQYTMSLQPTNYEQLLSEENEVLLVEDNFGVLIKEINIDSDISLTTQTLYEPKPRGTLDPANILPTITLPETGIKLRLERLSTDPVTFSGRWYIALEANPAPAITTLFPSLEMLGEPLFLELFGLTDEEPYATFKNLWFDHPLPAYRLAGLVMAYIYRVEGIRAHSNG
ncbi:hypothetical protein EBZ80_19430 [bacterium]|nr:hypothetical protein [Betaproteobacteria bacterium]NDE17098.1 hypothetical protein [bacterium]